jgi:hypothetical protein
MAAAADSILSSSPSALALSPLQRVHAAAFVDAHDALGLAVTCYPMHLLPINSTGVGGVAFSFIESVEWLRRETVQDYDVYAGKIEAASRQVEEAIAAMREGMRRGWMQAAVVLQRVEEQVSTRSRRHVVRQLPTFPRRSHTPLSHISQINATIQQAPTLLRAPLDDTPCSLPPALHHRIDTAISAFVASLSAFLQFFKVPLLPALASRSRASKPCLPQGSYLPLCPVHSPSICRHAPNGAECYAACLKARPRDPFL